MGDCQNEDLRVDFDSRLKLKFVGSQVTSDTGLLAYRELDEALGLTEMGADVLTDSRQGRNKQHQLVPLLRQSIYSRLAGYEDVNDAERLCVDPALRHVVGGRASQPDKQAASSSEVGRFETETLSTKRNLTALMNFSGRWIDNVHRRRPLKELILDMDSSVSETYGQQQGTAYNGHFECLCYHPLFLFNQHGDLESAMLRRGNHAAAWQQGQREILAECAAAGDRALSPLEHSEVLSRRRRVCHPRIVRLPRSRELFVCDPSKGQRRIGAGNRAFAHPSGRTTFPQAQGFLSQLSVSSEVVAATAPRGGQD
jgi:hypothetical protein